MHFSIKFNWSKLDDEVPNSALLFAQRHSHWDSHSTVRVPCICLHLHTYGQWNYCHVRADTAPVVWVIKWKQEWHPRTWAGEKQSQSHSSLRQKRGYFGACLRLHDPAALGLVHAKQTRERASRELHHLLTGAGECPSTTTCLQGAADGWEGNTEAILLRLQFLKWKP